MSATHFRVQVIRRDLLGGRGVKAVISIPITPQLVEKTPAALLDGAVFQFADAEASRAGVEFVFGRGT